MRRSIWLFPISFLTERARGESTFSEGIVAHVAFHTSVGGRSGGRARIYDAKHRRGTYLCMEGPAFSTKAESEVYRSWEWALSVVTNLQKPLARRRKSHCHAGLWLR